jgi:hypothetical protein
MFRNLPYQPLLLRLLHGINGCLIIGSIITGFWVYNTLDGRWGKLPLPNLAAIQDIHGTIAVCFFLLIPVFALYSFHPGEKRLLQPDSLNNLTNLNQKIGWYSWHRLVNTLMLLAAILAAFSGRTMKEEWLPNGELNHPWYYLHLFAWLVMVLCLVLHLLMVAKVGGIPLILSMFNWQVRPQDSPRHWKTHTVNWLKQQKSKFTQK